MAREKSGDMKTCGQCIHWGTKVEKDGCDFYRFCYGWVRHPMWTIAASRIGRDSCADDCECFAASVARETVPVPDVPISHWGLSIPGGDTRPAAANRCAVEEKTMTKQQKADAWAEAAVILDVAAMKELWSKSCPRGSEGREMWRHIADVIVPSLRRRAEIIARRKTRGT